MQLFWPASTQTTGATGTASTDVIAAAGHPFTDGDPVFFLAGTGFTGLTAGRRYFVRDSVAATSFKLAATAAGAAIDITVDGTAGIFAAAVEISNGDSYVGGPAPRIEGAQDVDPIDPWAAADATTAALGKRRRSMPVSVAYEFTSPRLAGEFHLERYAALADSGPLLAIVGATGDTAERYAPAVLASYTSRWEHGLIIIADHLFQVEPFAA